MLDLNLEDPVSAEQLSWGKKAPEQVESGLLFEHGAEAHVRSEVLEPLEGLLESPFGVSVAFTATAKPDGHYGGLVETGTFRIMLHYYSMKVCVMVADPEGNRIEVKSSEPVTIGEPVQFEFRVSKGKGVLLRNGRVDTIVEASLPAYPLKRMRLGVAGGKDYFFNGVIHRVQAFDLSSDES